jgi:DNA processing protein
MDTDTTRQCLLWHSIPQLDEKLLARLLLHYGSAEALACADPREWRALGVGLRPVAAARVAQRLGHFPGAPVDIDTQLRALEQLDASILTIADDNYPALLRTISRPPPLLYVRGGHTVLSAPQLAVVGSRRASSAGCRAAADLAAQAAMAGMAVVSGLARGIDGAAHRGALRAGGQTVAVMATGVDLIYPARHRELAADIVASGGALVTEFPPGVGPLRQNFPRRNRIISGLALGVLVVEAALPSGSLITAATALDQGREVLALPWSVYHQGGRGCLQLLRDGAVLVQDIADITTAVKLPAAPPGQAELFATDDPDGCTSRILPLVGYEATSVDELARTSALPVQQVLAELATLELRGAVRRCAGGYIHT